MTTALAVWLALGGLAMAGLAACGVKALQDFSHYDLEAYCQARGRRARFSDILHHHKNALLAAETLALLGLATAAASGGWMLATCTRPLTLWPLLGVLAAASLSLLLVVVWVPAAVARVLAPPLLFHAWPLWRGAGLLLKPFAAVAAFCQRLLLRLAGRHEEQDDEEEAFEDEIRTMVRAGLHEGLLEEDAQEMIESVIELSDIDVSDIMTPRSDVDAIDVDLDWPQVLDFVIRVRRTRIPVYEKTLDHVLGVLYVKDLLPELAGRRQPLRPLRDLVRQPWFVPKTNPVDDMLQEFLRTRNHLAVVVDEYRAVAGVVTIEDVLEEIVGEIVDEFDPEVEQQIQPLDEGIVEACGKAHLDDLNEYFGAVFPEPEDYDTIGGLLVSQLGRIPQVGETLTCNQIRVIVLAATRRRVERVRLERLEQPKPESTDAQ